MTNTCPSTTSAHCDQWHGVLGNSINELHPHFPWPHITYEHTNTRPYSLFRVISFRRQDCEVLIMMSPYLYCINVSPVVHSSKYTHSHLCIPRLHFCSVVEIFFDWPTHTSNFRTCRCWQCHCYPPAQVEEPTQGGSKVHEPCANPLVCQIMWQTSCDDHQESQTLQGRHFTYLSHTYSWSIHSV